MDFVQQQYWDSSYRDFNYYVAADDVTKWIEDRHPQNGNGRQLFEFGCYPGRYLSYMGKRGWVVNGLDLTPEIERNFLDWLKKEDIRTGKIERGDALAYAETTTDRYDMVCSFGFIEHFENFLQIVELHDRILAPGGWLIITTPNFRGAVQKLLHSSFNKRSLQQHYLPSMRPFLWRKKLESVGYEVIHAEYFGKFDFWYDEEKRSPLKNFSLKLIRKATPFLKNLPNHSLYSPYCGIIAQKPEK